MQRVRLAVTVALGVLGLAAPLGLATPAAAQATPTPLPIPVPSATPPATVCTISATGSGAIFLTGLVATANGYVAVDGNNTVWGKRVVFLNKSCQRTSTRSYTGSGATDPQDIAVDNNGTYWIADTGDDPVQPTRSTISLWKLTGQNGSFTRYDFSYPDGPHNAEALLLNGDGSPIFVTKSIDGPAGIYTHTGKLSDSSTMALTKVGSFTPEQTGTPNKLGDHGQAQNAVTGGANSPDGTKVVLRTLTDAYQWNVTGGNVVTALTTLTKKPSITRLASDEQGYAIAFTTDGGSYLTVSDVNAETPLYRYTPSPPVAPSTKASAKAPKTPAPPGFFRRWFNSLSLSDVMWLLGGVAAFGLVLVGVGIYGIRRARARNARAGPPRSKSGSGRPGGPGSGGQGGQGSGRSGGSGSGGSGRATPPVPVGGGAGVYGSPRPPQPPDPYGYTPPADPPGGGNQYSGHYSGGVYGAPVDPYQDAPKGYPDDRQYPGDGYGHR